MFTGDGSARFLISALHQFGFANQGTSESIDDGLLLRDAYMTAIVRCAPPKNKPTLNEIANCKRYWTQELHLLQNVRIVLALGRIAFDSYVKFLKNEGVETKGLDFKHGALYVLPKPYPALCASYHPSRQNTQTGRLTVTMFEMVFEKIHSFLVTGNTNVH
jgi:uracil-DNA glycosylase family 4